jgi:GNAT superfamily N-acetyltransferase
MDVLVAVCQMEVGDLTAVLDIQALCYDPTKLESRRSFLSKLEASPATCFIARIDEASTGYLVAVPAEAGSPPPLHGLSYPVPPNADALYLHDLAVHPQARGFGVAGMLIDAYFKAAKRSGFRFACLTAVNGASRFWERYGFQKATGSGIEDMTTYGADAVYMSMGIGG